MAIMGLFYSHYLKPGRYGPPDCTAHGEMSLGAFYDGEWFCPECAEALGLGEPDPA